MLGRPDRGPPTGVDRKTMLAGRAEFQVEAKEVRRRFHARRPGSITATIPRRRRISITSTTRLRQQGLHREGTSCSSPDSDYAHGNGGAGCKDQLRTKPKRRTCGSAASATTTIRVGFVSRHGDFNQVTFWNRYRWSPKNFLIATPMSAPQTSSTRIYAVPHARPQSVVPRDQRAIPSRGIYYPRTIEESRGARRDIIHSGPAI